MKQVTSMSRLRNQLEKMFRALNADFFDNALEMPVITVTPTARAYAHYVPVDIWESKTAHKREINISSAYLNRPLEALCASLLHEMVHYYNDTILNIQDCSRGGTYHPKAFKEQAEAHGLICTRTEKYGWSDTSSVISDVLIEWLLNHDELREIEMCRVNPGYTAVGVGTRSADGAMPVVTTTRSNSRRYICPCCHTIIRATRSVNILCGDCMETMLES